MPIDRTPTPPPLVRLTFGLVPFADNDQVRAVLGDFCALLSDAVGVAVSPHRAPSPPALASAVESGRVQIAWTSPTLLLMSERLTEVVPLVSSVRGGVAAYHAALFVRDDSLARTTADLAGLRAAWVDPTSAAGYIFPRIALAREGIDPRTLFASETFYESHGEVARAVLEGEADVGATFAVFEDSDPRRPLLRAGFRGAVPGHDGRVIAATGPIPSDVIVAAPSVSAATRTALAVALAKLGQDPHARKPLDWLFGVEGFAPYTASAFNALRAAVAAGRALGVLPATAKSDAGP